MNPSTLRAMTCAVALTGVAGCQSTIAPHAFAAPWIDGSRDDEPLTQVQRYDRDTFVIRQSIRTNFEGPFLYLIMGGERAILIDSGAGGLAIRPEVMAVLDGWLRERQRRAIPLIVAHSHSHGDHVAGDAEFRDQPGITVVGTQPAAVAEFFGIRDWPAGLGRLDLGGRVLDVIATPGHEPSQVMYYDRRTRLLFSGDALYPGRLYFPRESFTTYREGIARVTAFAATHPVSHILGAHIEMTRSPGVDYPMRAASHPDEHPLELGAASLAELDAALAAMGDSPVREAHADFIIYPRP